MSRDEAERPRRIDLVTPAGSHWWAATKNRMVACFRTRLGTRSPQIHTDILAVINHTSEVENQLEQAGFTLTTLGKKTPGTGKKHR